jgi:hypothetical protein
MSQTSFYFFQNEENGLKIIPFLVWIFVDRRYDYDNKGDGRTVLKWNLENRR